MSFMQQHAATQRLYPPPEPYMVAMARTAIIQNDGDLAATLSSGNFTIPIPDAPFTTMRIILHGGGGGGGSGRGVSSGTSRWSGGSGGGSGGLAEIITAITPAMRGQALTGQIGDRGNGGINGSVSRNGFPGGHTTCNALDTLAFGRGNGGNFGLRGDTSTRSGGTGGSGAGVGWTITPGNHGGAAYASTNSTLYVNGAVGLSDAAKPNAGGGGGGGGLHRLGTSSGNARNGGAGGKGYFDQRNGNYTVTPAFSLDDPYLSGRGGQGGNGSNTTSGGTAGIAQNYGGGGAGGGTRRGSTVAAGSHGGYGYVVAIFS